MSMPPLLTLARLERHLDEAVAILRGRVDGWACKDYLFCLLFLKRCSDTFEERCAWTGGAPPSAPSGDGLSVPPEARWSSLCSATDAELAERLDRALTALARANPALEGAFASTSFRRLVEKSRVPPQVLRAFLQHVGRYRLRSGDLASPDLLGAAYEYVLAEFAGDAGKHGGVFYTPPAVAQIMVDILRPAPGMHIYDPCCGSGGLLLRAERYIEDCGHPPGSLLLFGQELSGQAWSLCKMNMLLSGVPGADIRLGDTLADPQHLGEDGALLRFDRIISNPPYSQNYSRAALTFGERFRYGFCPESGNRADLMFVQHMLAVLSPAGRAATVVPHGVLFRGGAELAVRQGLVEDDVLEAVIGLPANLFYRTGIPACILVLCAPGAKPAERWGRVLFIDAGQGYTPGRGQNSLSPAHRERIVRTFEAFGPAPAYAAVVHREDLARNGWNLNISRYAESAPEPEPYDVRALLSGGVPVGEVEAKRTLFASHGLDLSSVLLPREHDAAYLDFHPSLGERGAIARLIASQEGVRCREEQCAQACRTWWAVASEALPALLARRNLVAAQEALARSFREALSLVGLLDSDALAGVFATWWDDLHDDLQVFAARGFADLLGGWAASIPEDGEDLQRRRGECGHALIGALLPAYRQSLIVAADELARKLGESACFEADGGGDGETLGELEEAEAVPQLTDEELRTRKRELTTRRARLRALQGQAPAHLQEALAALAPEQCRQVALDILLRGLLAHLEREVTAQRRRMVAAVETWWDKYRDSLREIEARCKEAERRMDALWQQLGYLP